MSDWKAYALTSKQLNLAFLNAHYWGRCLSTFSLMTWISVFLILCLIAAVRWWHDCLPVRCISHHSRIFLQQRSTDSLVVVWVSPFNSEQYSGKTQALSVGPCACHYSLFLSNARIEFLLSIKILGVTLDKDLSYKENISDQLEKAYAKASALRRIKRFLPLDARIKLFII